MAAMRLMSNYPIQLHYVVQKFGYLQNKGTKIFSGILCQTVDVRASIVILVQQKCTFSVIS